MKIKYRIVRDDFLGYEVQFKLPLIPFWFEHGFSNTHKTVEKAKKYIEKCKSPVVWTED